MSDAGHDSPALVAARDADERMLKCLRDGQSFLLEAGAGAGKTYSLVEALKMLIASQSKDLRRAGRRIACITYTNAATAIISSRIDGNVSVFADTIHALCWSLIKGFQGSLRAGLKNIPAWTERIAEAGGVQTQLVEYDLGFRRITPELISLHHDDVLTLTVALLASEKFQRIFAERFPIVLIDEYQDTNAEVMEAIKNHLLEGQSKVLLGLFGDHWQRIYDKTCGHVTHEKIAEIGKGANFRSGTAIVSVLNNMRKELPQAVKDETFVGSAEVFHSNGWTGQRRPGTGGGHWKGDLPADIAHTYLQALIEKLKAEGWDFAADKTKILMLTHNVLASEQGYSGLMQVFPFSDLLFEKEDDFIAFFADKLEPACAAYTARHFGEMFEVLGDTAPRLSSYADKDRWAQSMTKLLELRDMGTIGEVIDHLTAAGFPRLPEAVLGRNADAKNWQEAEGQEMPESVARVRKLRDVPYKEIVALDQFINGHTPFATKHSVKGDEFENVLVVVGRGWNRYNFDQYLDWARDPAAVPADKRDAYERNRNLFYVSCSRPTTRLALLFTQEVSAGAMQTLRAWFGDAKVQAFAPN
jgi:DNA helicase-2/ATP-dependent DNA helicase PcrA